MVLLSGMMRSVAVTGRTDHVHAWVADRQAGAWAERTMRAALPRSTSPAPAATAPPSADPAETLRRLGELRDSGVLSGDEVERLRIRAGL